MKLHGGAGVANSSMKKLFARSSPAVRYGSILALLVLGGLVGGVCFRSPPLPPIVVFPQPYNPPARKASWLERCIPATPAWGWFWHLKERVLGRPKPINLEVTVVELSAQPESALAGFALGEPEVTSGGDLRIWRLGNARLTALRRHFQESPEARLVASPRCSTADKIECQMFIGQGVPLKGATNFVGLAANFYPRVHRDTTDLTSSFLFSEVINNPPGAGAADRLGEEIAIVTNLAVATRIQIPKEQGVLLIASRRGGSESRRFGLIIWAERPRAKK